MKISGFQNLGIRAENIGGIDPVILLTCGGSIDGLGVYCTGRKEEELDQMMKVRMGYVWVMADVAWK